MLTPSAALAKSATYTVAVKGGAGGIADPAGSSLAANVTSSFTTTSVATTFTLFANTATPATIDSGDKNAAELGVKFTASQNGFITGIRFYKAAGNTGVHSVSLWSSTGQLMDTDVTDTETASGWQEADFETPVAITAGTTYVASYHTTVGHYSVNQSYFTSSYVNGPLTVPAGGGVYLYGGEGSPPTVTNAAITGSNLSSRPVELKKQEASPKTGRSNVLLRVKPP